MSTMNQLGTNLVLWADGNIWWTCRYVCKWCGHVCTSMADLNMHKADVHGQPVTRSREDMRRRTLQANVSRKIPSVERPNIPLGMTASARPSTVMSADALRSSTNGKLAPAMGDTPCRCAHWSFAACSKAYFALATLSLLAFFFSSFQAVTTMPRSGRMQQDILM